MHSIEYAQPNTGLVITFPLFSSAVRIGYALMLLCIGTAAVFVYVEQQRMPVLGLILGGFSFFVLCYVDRWKFICAAEAIEYTVGFLCFSVTKRYAFSDIEKTETEQFTRGLFKTPFIKCILYLHTGEKQTVAIFSARNTALKQRWETVSMLLKKR